VSRVSTRANLELAQLYLGTNVIVMYSMIVKFFIEFVVFFRIICDISEVTSVTAFKLKTCMFCLVLVDY